MSSETFKLNRWNVVQNIQGTSAIVSPSRYVPWQRVDAWSCQGCGGCCHYFGVTLRPYEYALLTKLYGPNIVGIDDVGNPCLKKVDGRCIFQDSRGLCVLQSKGMKPLACKIWPFKVDSKSRYRPKEALFIHKGKKYYVYVDRSYPCKGIGAGKRDTLFSAISEVIELLRNPTKPQFHSTSPLSLINHIPPIRGVVGSL